MSVKISHYNYTRFRMWCKVCNKVSFFERFLLEQVTYIMHIENIRIQYEYLN